MKGEKSKIPKRTIVLNDRTVSMLEERKAKWGKSGQESFYSRYFREAVAMRYYLEENGVMGRVKGLEWCSFSIEEDNDKEWGTIACFIKETMQNRTENEGKNKNEEKERQDYVREYFRVFERTLSKRMDEIKKLVKERIENRQRDPRTRLTSQEFEILQKIEKMNVEFGPISTRRLYHEVKMDFPESSAHAVALSVMNALDMLEKFSYVSRRGPVEFSFEDFEEIPQSEGPSLFLCLSNDIIPT